jgi:hypothetical protein
MSNAKIQMTNQVLMAKHKEGARDSKQQAVGNRQKKKGKELKLRRPDKG